MKIALLLYGTMNTHKKIYSSDDVTVYKALSSVDADFNVFIYTENKGFFKNTPEQFIDNKLNTIYDYPIIHWIEKRYCVSDISKSTLENDFNLIYGDKLKHYLIEDTPFNKEQWAESTESYTQDNTTNNWRNTLISTFFYKKRKSFEMAAEYADINLIAYDAYILARPDSMLIAKTQKNSNQDLNYELGNIILDEIKKLLDCRNKSFLVDYGHSKSDLLAKDLKQIKRVIKNDICIGTRESMDINTQLYNVILNQGKGNYFNIYNEHMSRCTSCYNLSISSNANCSACDNKMINITEWPEYKMHEHLIANHIQPLPLSFTGKVVR